MDLSQDHTLSDALSTRFTCPRVYVSCSLPSAFGSVVRTQVGISTLTLRFAFLNKAPLSEKNHQQLALKLFRVP